MLYNFTSAVLRAAGDTVRPLIYLIVSGVANIALNLVFVLGFNLDVAGVAIATTISQGLSALLCIISLLKSKEIYRLIPKYIKIYPKELKEVLIIGVPTGIQSMLFAIANVTMQSHINSFGEYATAGNSVASTIDAILYHVIHAFGLTVLTFTGQNYGAGNYERIITSKNMSIVLECTIGLLAGIIMLVVAAILVPILANNPETIFYAQKRLWVMGFTYFVCGIMDCYSCAMRGVGRSISAMVISLIGSCVLRIIYLEIIRAIPAIYSIDLVYLTWPISWIITIIIYVFVTKATFKKVKREIEIKVETASEGEVKA
jgi:Na+-driven multidrug efflux pump